MHKTLLYLFWVQDHNTYIDNCQLCRDILLFYVRQNSSPPFLRCTWFGQRLHTSCFFVLPRDKMLNNNEQRWILVYLPKLIYLHLNPNHFSSIFRVELWMRFIVKISLFWAVFMFFKKIYYRWVFSIDEKIRIDNKKILPPSF